MKLGQQSGLYRQTQKLTQPFTRRAFSSVKPPSVNNTGAYMLMGAGAFGMGFLALKSV